MSNQRLSLISLPVDDVAAARDFYAAALGWEAAPGAPGEPVFYQFNGFVLGLGERSTWGDEQLGIDPPAYAVVAINFASTDEVDGAVNAWRAAGGDVLKDPVQVFWGGYSGYVRDPWGNLIEMALNPFWEVTEDGRTVIPGA